VASVLALAAAALTFHVLCDAVFDCGCTWIWTEADRHCDVHVPGPPDCPPCSDVAAGALFSAVLLGGWALVLRGVLALWPAGGPGGA
jgi:hypothetical protein